MDINRIAIRLGIPEITRIALQNMQILPQREEVLKQLFQQDAASFANTIDPLEILWLYLHWIKDAKAAFDRRGIPESVFWDSMTDVGIWSRDYFSKTGLPGIGEPQWVAKSLKLEVIRLGRLQFEAGYLDQEIQDGQSIERRRTCKRRSYERTGQEHGNPREWFRRRIKKHDGTLGGGGHHPVVSK